MEVGAEASSGFWLGVASGIGIALMIFMAIARVRGSSGSKIEAEQKGKYKQIELVEC